MQRVLLAFPLFLHAAAQRKAERSAMYLSTVLVFCSFRMSSSGATTAFTLSLSTLPTDPLATVVLYLTEGALAQLLRTQKAMLTRELESDEFWRERCCSTFGQHLQHIQVQ